MRLRPLVLFFAVALSGMAAARDAQTLLHLLDYVGVDYPAAIEGGRIKNEDEYEEMLEFTAQVSEQAKALAENPAKAALVAQAEALAQVKPSPIAFSLKALDEALAALRKGERAAAQRLAITAYLEGFELVGRASTTWTASCA
ncbi:MAG: hypothetical protein AB1773_06315 [Pseudomonadota bacterium]